MTAYGTDATPLDQGRRKADEEEESRLWQRPAWKEVALGDEGLRIGDEECGFGKAQQRQRSVRPRRLRTRGTTAAAVAAASTRVATAAAAYESDRSRSQRR